MGVMENAMPLGVSVLARLNAAEAGNNCQRKLHKRSPANDQTCVTRAVRESITKTINHIDLSTGEQGLILLSFSDGASIRSHSLPITQRLLSLHPVWRQ